MSAGAESRPWADLTSMHAAMAAGIDAMSRDTRAAMMRLGAALEQSAPDARTLLWELVVRAKELRADLECLAAQAAGTEAVYLDGVAYGEARAAARQRRAAFAVIRGEAAGALARA